MQYGRRNIYVVRENEGPVPYVREARKRKAYNRHLYRRLIMHVGGGVAIARRVSDPACHYSTQKTPAQLKNQSSTAHYNKPQTTSTRRPHIPFPSPSPSRYHHRQST